METKLHLFLLAVLLASSTNALSQDPNFYIYLCFGQSNMESGGKMDEMDQTVDKRFQSWRILIPPTGAGRRVAAGSSSCQTLMILSALLTSS